MLAIRLQRVGRKGLSHFRMIVQESRFSPKSGKIVETIGSYNPHSKETIIDKDAISKYLTNGAQPSERVVKILMNENVKLPNWVRKPKTRKKNPKSKSDETEDISKETSSGETGSLENEVAQKS